MRALQKRHGVSRDLARRLRKNFDKEYQKREGEVFLESRAKEIERIREKLTRERRAEVAPCILHDSEVEWVTSIQGHENFDGIMNIHERVVRAFGGLRDLGGVRTIPDGNYAQDEVVYTTFQRILDVLGITSSEELTVFLDRFLLVGPEEWGLRSIHMGIIYEDVPVELQFRTMQMDFFAKTRLLRKGLDKPEQGLTEINYRERMRAKQTEFLE